MTNANPFDVLRDELTEIVRSIVREEVQKLKAEQSKEAQPASQEDDRLVGREAAGYHARRCDGEDGARRVGLDDRPDQRAAQDEEVLAGCTY